MQEKNIIVAPVPCMKRQSGSSAEEISSSNFATASSD